MWMYDHGGEHAAHVCPVDTWPCQPTFTRRRHPRRATCPMRQDRWGQLCLHACHDMHAMSWPDHLCAVQVHAHGKQCQLHMADIEYGCRHVVLV